MTFLFIVQGEGRGHMTQAISLAQLLRKNGHTVCEVLVGKSSLREIPAFFYERIGAPVHSYPSPNFTLRPDQKGIRYFSSIWQSLHKSSDYFRSVRYIRQRVRELKPDVVVNFYEILAGMASAVSLGAPMVSIGHQYLLSHPDFPLPKNKRVPLAMLQLHTWITAIGSTKKLALSFRPMTAHPRRNTVVVPPLMRSEVLSLSPQNKGYLLGYMLVPGFAEEVIRWHKQHPEVVVHFFWDKKDAPEVTEVDPNLFFHQINDRTFIELMNDCSAYASTAGFESICEAMYLHKPLLMVPTHIEQECNALDAQLTTKGIGAKAFDLDQLLAFEQQYNRSDTSFNQWVQQAETIFIRELSSIK